MPQTFTPCVTDNDNGKITVTLDDSELRGWSYASDDERRQKMKMAREYVEGWWDASNTLRPQLDAANEKLNLANTGGLSLLYDIRRELGWNDKTSLSILPSGVRRVRRALQTWDTPSDMDLQALARAVKGRVVELERIRAEDKTQHTKLQEGRDEMLDALHRIAGGFINSDFVLSTPPDWHSAFVQLQAIAAAAITKAETTP